MQNFQTGALGPEARPWANQLWPADQLHNLLDVMQNDNMGPVLQKAGENAINSTYKVLPFFFFGMNFTFYLYVVQWQF